MPNPHDGFSKYVFRNLRRAREELANAVGPRLAALIDWDTLRLEPTELADQALDARYADLRFTARLAGLPVRLDLVFEHQSESDPWMPIRMFCHAGAIWNGVRKEREREVRRRKRRARPPARVPLVLSIVLHNGPRRWTAPTELAEVIEGADVLREHAPDLLPRFPILIDDLADQTDEAIRARPQSASVRLALLLLKHARTGDTVNVIEREGDLVQQSEVEDPGVLREGIRYSLRADPWASKGRLRLALRRQLGRRGEEMVMTEGDRLMAAGRAEGRVEGEARGQAKSIFNVLKARGLRIPANVRAQIEGCTDPRQLARWVGRAVTARNAHEVISLPQSDMRRQTKRSPVRRAPKN
jgi:hypothetical protein